MTTRHLVLLLTVSCCLPTPAAFAQDEAERMAMVLAAGDPEAEALVKHRLTVENVRKMFAVDRELFTLFKEDADLGRRMSELAQSIDPQRKLGTVTLDAQVYEGIPELAQILRRHQISGREYMLTYAVVISTLAIDFIASQEAQREGSKEIAAFMTQGLKFWRSMDPTLKAEAEAWKKMRGYDKGISR